MISITKGSHHMPTTKSTLFAVIKDEWDTKESFGKFHRRVETVQALSKRIMQN